MSVSSNATTLISTFQTLPYQQKITKIQYMLQSLQEVGGIISELNKLIQINPKPAEEILDMIYTTIIQTADQIQQQLHDSKIKEFENIRAQLDKIRHQEQSESTDHDDILSKI